MYYLGIDIGGTNIKIALCAGPGRILKKEMFPTLPGDGFSRIMGRIKQRISAYNLNTIKSIGIGVAGLVRPGTGRVILCPNLKWENVDIKKSLRALRKKVFVDNDANCAAWGVYLLEGIKHNSRNMAVITLGTGVGGGLIINGSLFRGSDGFAGEIGHIKIREEHEIVQSSKCKVQRKEQRITNHEPQTTNYIAPKCGCGREGCLETYVGTAGILRIAQTELASSKSSLKDITDLMPKDIAQAGERGDQTAIRILIKVGNYIGKGIAGCANLLNPDTVVLAGGVSNAGNLILPHIRQAALKDSMKMPKIKICSCPQDIGVIGAALLEKSG